MAVYLSKMAATMVGPNRRHANASKERTLLADVDVAPPHGVA